MKKPLSNKLFARIPTPSAARLAKIPWYAHRWQILLGTVFVALGVGLYPRHASFHFADLREGDIYLGDEIIAPFTFSINKSPEQYEADKQVARESVYPVFVRYDSIADGQVAKLDAILAQMDEALQALVPDSLKMQQLQRILGEHRTSVSPAGIRFLVENFARHNDSKREPLHFEEFRARFSRVMRDLYSIGILSTDRKALPAHVTKVSVRRGSEEMVNELQYLYTADSVNSVILQKLRESNAGNDLAVNIGYQLVTSLMPANLVYDQHDTEQRIAEAVSRVPRARGVVLENERIIQSHEKITREHIQKIQSLVEARIEIQKSDGVLTALRPILGKTITVALAAGFFGIFLYFWRQRIYWDLSRLVLIFFILMVVLFAGNVISKFSLSEYLIPVALAAMLLTVFFDARLAVIAITTVAALLGSMRGNEFTIAFVSLIVGMAAALPVRKVRSRTWIFKAMAYIAVAYVLIITAFAFVLHSPTDRLLANLLDGLVNAVVSPLVAYGLIVILEYVFDVTTDATLLELSDLNRPLLRELALRAPGSYHHSILVGTLSEAAAEGIGANSLLARVGAYYHDIGKTDKPEYFVENQKGGRNPHNKLTPTMSALVIINHVKCGLEIAESKGLPKDLRDFIPQHHGTNLVTYFYHKAREQCNAPDEVQETNFRYPGPKPQAKETGIVMLADGVEAAARTLKDPTVSRIRAIVRQIIGERFTSGQLDECPLTLRDLNQIRDSFERTLVGIFHGRIQYPNGQNLELPGSKVEAVEKPGHRTVAAPVATDGDSSAASSAPAVEQNVPRQEDLSSAA